MRRKSAAPPPPPSSGKRKEKGRSFAPFRRGDSSRSFQDIEENGRDLTPVTSFGSQRRQSSSEPINSEPQNDTLAATSTVNGTKLPHTPEPSRPVQLQVNNLHVTPDPQYQALSPQE